MAIWHKLFIIVACVVLFTYDFGGILKHLEVLPSLHRTQSVGLGFRLSCYREPRDTWRLGFVGV